MSNRLYFDYNATSPLSKKVIDFLRSGDFFFANPASLHQSGKKARRYLTETTEYLFSKFALKSEDFNLVYHSGATEGINAFFKGRALTLLKEKKKGSFFFSTVDHSAVVQLKDFLELLGHNVFFFPVHRDGSFDLEGLISCIDKEKSDGRECLLNFTAINNETGVVWPLELALKIKESTGSLIHVDAVQLPGKVSDWEKLCDLLDGYTFSGHKFGALKGVGFSFVKKSMNLSPLLDGGSQQEGLRPGTENPIGVYTLKLALMDLVENFHADETLRAKKFIEQKIIELLGDKGEVVALKASRRNINTIFIVIYGQKAETLSAKFDIQGVDLSTGSACSSGIIKENRVLINMGYCANDSRSSLRFSFSPTMTMEEGKLYALKIEKVLKTIL